MTNRVLIRNKILQIVFSAFIDRDKTIAQSEMEYVHSIKKTYDLYILLLQLIVKLTDVLGLIVEKEEELLAEDIEALIAERQAARKAKNFARADEIREILKDMGIVVEDTRQGAKWKRV